MSKDTDNQTHPTGLKTVSLEELLQPSRLTRVVDIGANPIDGDPPYKGMLEQGLCHLTGFEPQAAALAKLNARKGPNERYLPLAVGDGTRATLNLCQASGMTSLLKPDPEALAMFNEFPRIGLVVGNVDIDTCRLDDIDEIQTIDLLKIDVQGSELSVFRNGRNKLRSAVAIQTEVSFITIYENQPPFGEIDLELRAQGFVPHCFAGVRRWPIAPIVFDGDLRAPLNQLLEADIVYVRNFSKPDLLSTEQLQHLALIAHYCYGSYDLAAFCLHALVARGEAEEVDTRYLAWLTETGQAKEVEIYKDQRVVSRTKGTLNNLLSEARARHTKGDLIEAEKLYCSYIEVSPDSAEVLSLLGTLYAQKGDLEKAVQLIQRSLSVDEDQPFALNSLGNALNSLGRYDEALVAFDKALAFKPDHAAALHNRGTALRALHRPEEALASIDMAIASNSEYAEAYHNRGLALHDLSRLDDAVHSFDCAISLKPDFPDAYRNRGNALRGLKRFEEALTSYARAMVLRPDFAESYLDEGLTLEEAGSPLEALARYRQAIALKPNLPAAHYNAGNVLAATRRRGEALSCYETAITLKPDYAEAYNNLAGVLCALNRRADALIAYDRAIVLKPGLASAHHGRAQILREMGRYGAALAGFDKALALEPDRAEAHGERALALLDLGRLQEALTGFDRALELNPNLPEMRGLRWGTAASICDWTGREGQAQALRTAIANGLGVSTPFSLMTVPCGPDLHRKCAETFIKRKFSSAVPALRPSSNARSPNHRIRVAYVSADFRAHAVASLIAGTIEHHDRQRFEVSGISVGMDDRSPMRARLKGAFDHFIDIVDMSDDDVVALLREKQIDIVVDLMGFTRGSRLGIFASRPAPIQVNYLGNPGTTGADFFDYIIADRIVIPEDEHRFYSEKVVYMPATYQSSDSKRAIGETLSRSAAGLPEHGFVFCSFNRSDKITPEMFDIWMRLLHRTPPSVLWLRDWNATAAENLRRHAKARGIASDRLVFAGDVSNEEHLARYRLADLFLDTLPFGAHTTASDALWAGLPVLTCRGNTFPGRVAASLLCAVGLPELVTESLAEYETRALNLAGNPASLGEVKSRLQRNRETHPLFDTAGHTRALESAYETMMARHRSGRPPEAFRIGEDDGALYRASYRRDAGHAQRI